MECGIRTVPRQGLTNPPMHAKPQAGPTRLSARVFHEKAHVVKGRRGDRLIRFFRPSPFTLLPSALLVGSAPSPVPVGVRSSWVLPSANRFPALPAHDPGAVTRTRRGQEDDVKQSLDRSSLRSDPHQPRSCSSLRPPATAPRSHPGFAKTDHRPPRSSTDGASGSPACGPQPRRLSS